MGWSFLGIIFIVCAVLCAVGFYKFVYFLSIGYGFAIAGGGITVLIMAVANGWSDHVLLLAIAQAALFAAYGARLSGFLLVREFKNLSFKKTDVFKDTLNKSDDKKMPFFVLFVIWISVAVLYTAQGYYCARCGNCDFRPGAYS